ncbi:potassium transporter KefB [Algoriphagus sp. H41]|uniref:Potassium transporter KefB n=1 Tax=Algoriphagus oliviformis TaxID=2811231 RepID=A0ABS3C6S6_9BACT|nr:potassium transporter KefB [Algoriphagus oliviformis]MBN7812828.1 potassium transporter KefB [Algoriphagus oliviformis]
MKTSKHAPFDIELKSLPLPALLGAILPLALLLFLIISSGDSFKLWMAVPLTIIPAGGAFGGVFFYLMGFHWFPRGSQKLIAVIFSTLVYFVILWLSAVIAFNFTGHWD